MEINHQERDAADKIKESRQLMPRVLFFALIVLMSHLLELRPSTIDAGGVKIAVKDTIIIRGGIALVFYYYFLTMLTAWMDGFYFFPLKSQRHYAKNLTKSWKGRRSAEGKGNLTPAQVKKHVRSMLNFRVTVWALFSLARIYLMGFALIVALPDVWHLGEYIYAHLPDTKATRY